MLTKLEASMAVRAAKTRMRLRWADISDAVGRPVAWTTAALLGQHPMSRDEAEAAAALLGLDQEAVEAFQLQPTRGVEGSSALNDPTIYRLLEVIQVYGPTIKELIHEECGDGIMSAINFRLEVNRVHDPAGDRIVISLDGKFLAYQWE
ncbi:cyanate hydratase [Streptomyces sp. NRRL F-4489]|uniref:cyanase n=1 Tax=Streptomyces sp. NRRL F-4489 TaxID=1609095 RepID=UPI000747776D|nr:cyanase [Streptomyces sp. NRRL F-4489]KUL53507.1 cyanate hydratase [Streptomyces sp. NRRL F-4489]